MQALTKENLDQLAHEYITKLNRLDTSKCITSVDFRNNGPHNRFYDIRYDDPHFSENLVRNCSHNEQDCDCNAYNSEDSIDFVIDNCPKQLVYEEEKGKMYALHRSEIYTFPGDTTEFILHPKYSPIDPLQDQYAILGYYQTNQQINPTYQTKHLLSLNSIPILEQNLKRLNRELERQEAFKLCLAKICSV